jgi:hypothetical protein
MFKNRGATQMIDLDVYKTPQQRAGWAFRMPFFLYIYLFFKLKKCFREGGGGKTYRRDIRWPKLQLLELSIHKSFQLLTKDVGDIVTGGKRKNICDGRLNCMSTNGQRWWQWLTFCVRKARKNIQSQLQGFYGYRQKDLCKASVTS